MEWHDRLAVVALIAATIFGGLVRGKLMDKVEALEARVEMLERGLQ